MASSHNEIGYFILLGMMKEAVPLLQKLHRNQFKSCKLKKNIWHNKTYGQAHIHTQTYTERERERKRERERERKSSEVFRNSKTAQVPREVLFCQSVATSAILSNNLACGLLF